ncbi:MAG: OmpA family protein [Flavobacteriales bacterium]
MKKFILPIIVFASLVSCVSTKKYEALEQSTQNLEKQVSQKENTISQLKESQSKLNEEMVMTKSENSGLMNKVEILDKEKAYFKKLYEDLNVVYSDNVSKNSEELSKILSENAELIAQLQIQNKKMNELELKVQATKNQLDELKNRISEALKQFEGKGMNVTQKDGKIYISVENSLLFPSGSWKVQSKAEPAIKKLASVLEEDQDLNVLIEGHTDNVKYKGTGALEDNWDLSVKRATSIVKELLKNKKLDKKRITAAGRGEFDPIGDNTTKEGKAQNRRIEIIIQPDLSLFEQLVKE